MRTPEGMVAAEFAELIRLRADVTALRLRAEAAERERDRMREALQAIWDTLPAHVRAALETEP